MKRIINYILEQDLLVNLVVAILVIAGITSYSMLNRESLPDSTLDMVTVTTIYPGASPTDAEELVSIPIEKKLREVSGLDKVRAYNVENLSLLVLYIADDVKDKKKVVQDIKDAVEQVTGLPSVARTPLVAEVTVETTELVSVAFTGKDESVPYNRLREFANKSEGFFYDIDGIAEVEKYGYYDREYLVEVDSDALDRNRIGLNTIVNALKMRNIDFPGGPLRVGKKEFVLRTKGQFKNAEEIRNTIIRGNDIGYSLRIGDVAKVTDTYEEADVHHRFNGKQAIVFKLWKKRSADELKLAEAISKAAAGYSDPGYNDVDISLFNDKSSLTKNRIMSVVHEAILGFVILGLFMFLLLGRHMSALVLAGIPITFMATFAVMKYQDITINIISLFGMIMVLGMMVDFSIVIAENSHRYIEQGIKRKIAIENGVSEIFWSVTVTLLCIVIAFMPLLLVSGLIGRFIRAIPIVIIATLVASWFFAMFILPYFLNKFLGDSHKKGRDKREITLPQKLFSKIFGEKLNKFISREQKEDKNFEEGLFGQVQKKYKGLVTAALKHRYIVVGILLIFFISSLALIPGIGFKFITGGGEEQIRIKVKMPFETNLQSNLDEMKKLEQLIIESVPAKEFKALHLYVGEDYIDFSDPKPPKATYKSTFELYLVPEKERKRTADEINADLRRKISVAQESGYISREINIKLESVFLGPPVGKPVNVEIQGADYEVMKKIADEYNDFLPTVKGVRDITVDLESGKTEYQYTVNERMAAWTKISAYDIASAINASFSGSVATLVNQNEEEVGVRVRFPENARKDRTSLHDVKVSNMMGGLIPLDSVSNVTIYKGYSQINRLNFKRLVQVQAEVDTKIITPSEVTSILETKFADIGKRYPDYIIRYGGEQEDTNDTMSDLGNLFIAALIVIFVILTVYTQSLVMPLIIMIAIPFALVGVIFALFFHGQPLSFMSTLGLFSLAGIIVSNTLVLVQFINKFRDEGMPLKDALAEGGVVRLRPIILTAGSMFLELLPVMYGFGGKDYLVAPLALAFGWGLLFATFITLVLIPCFYYIAEDVKGLAAGMLALNGIYIRHTIYQPKVLENDAHLPEPALGHDEIKVNKNRTKSGKK
ncbi:MAG TPA: efflux RND transporter permease subunit [Spirochaetota bacterium]|nr:efflux RND transporter permease subunit [Spirochaetota bacterium]